MTSRIASLVSSIVRESRAKVSINSIVSCRDSNRLLTQISVIVCLITVLLTLLLPIYPDEIIFKIFNERYFLSHGLRQTMMPYCASGFLLPPPNIFLPAAISWSTLSLLGTGLLSYRFLPIACLILIFMTLYFLDRSNKNNSLTYALLITLGPTAYGISILRAEVFLLTSTIFLYALAIRFLQKIQKSEAIILMCFVFLLSSMIIFIHPKSIYLIPIAFSTMVIGAIFNFKGLSRSLLIIFCTLLFGALALEAIQMYQSQLTNCQPASYMNSFLKAQAINLFDIFNDYTQFQDGVSRAFSIEIWQRVISQLTFKETYDIGFLPSAKTTYLVKFINISIIGIFLLSVTRLYSKVCCGLIKPNTHIHLAKYVLLATSLFCYDFLFLTNLTKNFYDVALFVCSQSLIMGLISQISADETNSQEVNKFLKIFDYGLSIALILIAAISLTLNIMFFSKPLLNGYRGPSISDEKTKNSIILTMPKFLAENKIDSLEPIIVDDLTYDALKEHPITIPITYLLLNDPIKIAAVSALKQYKVKYGVTLCSYTSELTANHLATIDNSFQLKSGINICLFHYIY